MQPRKFRTLSAVTAGSLAVAAVAITASSGTSPTAKHAALTAQTESFPPVNLDACPTLHVGYPTGGCVAQLQTDLNIIQGNHLAVDGTFGLSGSQTYNAVTAFQTAHGLPQDGMVGPDTKKALEAALSVPTRTLPAATAAAVSLGVGEQLGPSEQISSPNGQYALIMQTDGNVVERAQGNRPVWSSTTSEGNSILRMQSDGNLVVIAPGNRPVWSTNTAGNPGSDLELQDDGNLVVYAQGHRAVWTSFAHGSTLAPAPTVPAPQPSSEPSSDCVATNECVATPRPLGTSEATPGATASEISRTDIPVIPALGRYRVGFFIMQKSYGILGVTGAGDGRGFDPQMDPSQNRVYLELDYTDGTARIVVNPSCNPERTSCTNPVSLTSGRVSISVSRANVSSDNPITATDFHVDIENSRETIHGFPRIRAEISFDTNPQGGLSVVGHTSSFPSVEIYHDAGASTVTVYTHEQARLVGAAALGIPALDQSFGINVTADGFVDRAY